MKTKREGIMLKKLPIKLTIEEKFKLTNKAIEARLAINNYNHSLERTMIDKEVLSFFSMKESLESNKIEGTQTTFAEIIESEVTGKKTADVEEVEAYYDAISKGEDYLKSNPFDSNFILFLHKCVLNTSKGREKSPGKFRESQVFIGNYKEKKISYTPPKSAYLEEYLNNLNDYINIDDELLDPIIKCGIVHAYFESIHPFLDGNGRVGRLLIIFYLLKKSVIKKPLFFLSEELEKNKYKYYHLLNGTRETNPNWIKWLEFFIDSSTRQANYYSKKLDRILELEKELLEFSEVNNIDRGYIQFIFKKPFFKISEVKEYLDVSYNSAKLYIEKLVIGGKIFPDNKKRNKIYRFYDLLDILRD